jgi:glycosyltransferase involved in cell wall biosynthesis
LNQAEQNHLQAPPSGHSSGGRYEWHLSDAVLGVSSRLVPHLAASTALPDEKFEGLLVPEKLESRTPREVTLIRRRLHGAAVAVLHDLIPLKFPEHAPQSAKRFSTYLETLLSYDGIAAISESSRQDLLAHWAEHDVKNPPPIETIPPAAGLRPLARESQPGVEKEKPSVLMVATIESRKNHLAVLEAVEGLWRKGLEFELTLVGRLRDASLKVVERVDALRSSGRPIRWLGHLPDAEVARLYQTCRFTLHPSLYEGFGLPVIESLSYGRPCIVSDRGALPEIARAGGCLTVNDTAPAALAAAIQALLVDESLYRRLVQECKERQFRSWAQYSDDLIDWLRSLRRRPLS